MPLLQSCLSHGIVTKTERGQQYFFELLFVALLIDYICVSNPELLFDCEQPLKTQINKNTNWGGMILKL